MYVLYSGQIRDWRIQASFREGGVEGWDCLLMGSPSPSPFAVCFTPTSPATSAEGLCLYNSGYLHWVRKHTHEHSRTLIHLLHRLWKKLLIHFVHTPSLKQQEGFHQCNMFHIFVFWKQYYAVYYWKCWQDLFSAPLQGRTGISAVLTCSADSCSVQLLERFGEIYSMLRWDSNLGWFKLKKLEFSPRTCCQITRLASPVYTLGFNCASLSSVLCICVVTHHGEYCEPATSTHLILNP